MLKKCSSLQKALDSKAQGLKNHQKQNQGFLLVLAFHWAMQCCELVNKSHFFVCLLIDLARKKDPEVQLAGGTSNQYFNP